MPRTSAYVLASLVSGVSAALILATGSSYTEARFPQGTAHHLKGGRSTCHGGEDGCWTSPYQIANLNSAEDFCLWAPSQPVLSVTEDGEHALVAWCLKGAHSTRLIPDGAVLGARLLITPEYVQITGVGNLSRINVPSEGVASASGDRFHSLVFTSAYGQLEPIYDWTSFVSQDRFCFRACRPSAVASTTCPPVRDVFGCAEDAPGSYDIGTFEDCVGDGLKVPSTLFQGVLAASLHEIAHPFASCMARRVADDARVTHARRSVACTFNCTTTSSTSSPAPTTTDNATTITFPPLPTSTSSCTACTNSSTPVSSIPPMSTANDTCTIYSHPHRHPHHHFSGPFASPSPSPSSNVSFSGSGCWGTTSSNLTSSASSPAWSTPSFTPTVSGYSSSDTLSFGTSPSVTTSPVPTSSSTSMYNSSDPLPVVTSPSGTSTSSPTFTPTSSSSYDMSSPPPGLSPSSLSSSSSTSPTLSATSPSSSASSPWVPVMTSSSSFPSDPTTTSSEPSQISIVSTPASSPLPLPLPSSSSSAPSSVSTFSPSPSPTFPNSQTQLGSQCPPPSPAAVNGAVRSVASPPSFLLSLILTIVSLSSIGVFVL